MHETKDDRYEPLATILLLKCETQNRNMDNDRNIENHMQQQPDNIKLTSSQMRKIKKPIIEKRRRERINESLNQLKNLVLEAMQKDENQYNKMEKADILELTVKHLKNLQQRHGSLATLHSQCNNTSSNSTAESPVNWTDKFSDGFRGCADEVTKYLKSAGVTPDVHDRLVNHLNSKLSGAASSDALNNNVPGLPSRCFVTQAQHDLPSVNINSSALIQTLPVLQPVTLMSGQTVYVAANAQFPALSPMGSLQNTTQLPSSCFTTSPMIHGVQNRCSIQISPPNDNSLLANLNDVRRNPEAISPSISAIKANHSPPSTAPVPIRPKPTVAGTSGIHPSHKSPVDNVAVTTDKNCAKKFAGCGALNVDNLLGVNAARVPNIVERTMTSMEGGSASLSGRYHVVGHNTHTTRSLWKPYQ